MQRKFSLIRLGFSGFLFSHQLRCFPEQPSFTWQKPGCFSFLAMTLPAGYVASHCRPPELRKTCSTRLPTCTLKPGTLVYTGAPCTLSTCSLADTLHMAPFTLYLAPCIWFLAHDPRRGAPCQTEPWHLAFWSTLHRWEKEVTQELE